MISSSRQTEETSYKERTVEGYERVAFANDPATGLRSFIAVHSTRRGPALGGCRFFSYPNEDAALADVLALARAMTYKAALADLKLGGGKAVILGNPRTDKNEALLRAYGTFVNRLNGTYITTEDSGTSPEDMDIVRKVTKHVTGSSPSHGGSGDPSPSTAVGVAEGIRACLKFVTGNDSFRGRRIAVQGIGHVGYPLARILHDAGAQVFVSDTNRAHLERAVRELKVEVLPAESILLADCDVLAPCALGGAITLDSVAKLRCKIVAGAANNQLASDAVGDALDQQGIVYAPDFVINAGGLISVSREVSGESAAWVETKLKKIHDTVSRILELSRERKTPTYKIAVELAQQRVGS